MLSNRGLGITAKKCLYERVIVPTAFMERIMRSAKRRKVNVLEIKCMRNLVGVWTKSLKNYSTQTTVKEYTNLYNTPSNDDVNVTLLYKFGR